MYRHTLKPQRKFRNYLKRLPVRKMRHLATKFVTNIPDLRSAKSKDGNETASPSGDGVCNCLCKPVLSVLPLLVDVRSVCTLN